jgi:hypothetical protein
MGLSHFELLLILRACFLSVVLLLLLLVVAQTEPANTAESQPPEDPQTSRFTWTIENFTRLNGKKHYSDVFVVGGFKW